MATDARTEVRHWWGERWLEALDATGPGAARAVRRGHGLARRGAVRELELEPGLITGVVTDERASSFDAVLRWPVPPDEAWSRALETLRSQLRHTAALTGDELPADLVDALAEAGVDLLPDFAVLEPACTCNEKTQPCRHTAALFVATAVQVDRDTSLVFTLRGRTRDELLERVRQGAASVAEVELDLSRGLDGARGDLEAIELRPTPVDDPAGLLRHLGPPPGVEDPRPLERLVEQAAATAWRLAAGDGAEAADEELLLAELRAQRTASAQTLASALGRDVEAVRGQLDELFETGEVLRTGAGEAARYRAASS